MPAVLLARPQLTLDLEDETPLSAYQLSLLDRWWRAEVRQTGPCWQHCYLCYGPRPTVGARVHAP